LTIIKLLTPNEIESINDETLLITAATTEEELAQAMALAELNGFNYIADAVGDVYELINLNVESEPDEGEPCIDEECTDYCIHCHNLFLIDGVINNTLKGIEPITPQQADTLIKLGQLKHLLGGI
jgi:hypothetical protein